MRIVSLLPSATEILCAIGLGDQLIGVTHECDYPDYVKHLPKVTETLIPIDASSREIDRLVREKLQSQKALYSLNRDALERLQPELIVTQALCDVCAVAEDEVREVACSLPGLPRVINLEPNSLTDVLHCMERVGDATGFRRQADAAVAALRDRLAAVEQRNKSLTHRPRVLLLEWIDPPFCGGHWSPELIRLAGGNNVMGREGEPSRTLSWQEIVAADPEVLIVACCGFDVSRTLDDIPILQARPEWPELSCAKSNQVYVVDGSAYFNRPGPRLVDSLEIVAHALHPSVHPLPDRLIAAWRAN